MNKKRLSVVMAGAMLATSVAPVLAAEVQKTETSANELGLLQEELRTLVESKTFSKIDENGALKGKSVYSIYVNDKDTGLDVKSTQTQWQNVFNKLDAGDVVKVYSKGFKEVDGVVYAKENKPAVYATYKTEADLLALVNSINSRIYDATQSGGGYENGWGPLSSLMDKDAAEYDTQSGRVVITFRENIGLNGANNNTISVGLNERKIDITKYLDEEGEKRVITRNTTCGKFYGFAQSTEVAQNAGPQDIASELVREISITPGGYDLTVEELYDGLMLTEKGHDFFTQIKEARAIGRDVEIHGNNVDDSWIGHNGTDYNNVADAIKMVGGKARFTVKFGAKDKLAAETYTISGLNEANAERLAKWMIKPLARVDILAGSDRYETAAKIAKEYADLTDYATSYHGYKANIVLVNGNALVDGLAASPLAAKLSYENGLKAPILLTEAGSLPRATETYLKEVIKNVHIGNLGDVTVHIVGGEGVVNKSIERKLKALGFKVERYGGEDREATSLAVAEAMGSDIDEAFVVGANGEADAMSIAAVAAETKTPIVVSNFNGLSEDALYELRGAEATIIGGDSVVSKADYDALKAEAKGVLRIAGSDRQATNAEIIKKYYKRDFIEAKNVIVAKDGYNNKTELVDALAAANMAAAKDAPIVLATKSLTEGQRNAIILNAKNAEGLYQVGNGVAREVVKTIATQLGLTNR